MMEERIAKTIQSLEHNGYRTKHFAEQDAAAAWLVEQIPAEATVGLGGSVTLQQLGLIPRLQEKGVELFPRNPQNPDKAEVARIAHAALTANYFFSSVNALTENGYILNVDGTGNRLAGTLYGPGEVFLVVGRNKIVPDLDAAIARVENVAGPGNCRRLGLKTPCVTTGVCKHCGPQSSICRAWLLFKYAPNAIPYTVIIVDADLGI